jgi:hypothetical protein
MPEALARLHYVDYRRDDRAALKDLQISHLADAQSI